MWRRANDVLRPRRRSTRRRTARLGCSCAERPGPLGWTWRERIVGAEREWERKAEISPCCSSRLELINTCPPIHLETCLRVAKGDRLYLFSIPRSLQLAPGPPHGDTVRVYAPPSSGFCARLQQTGKFQRFDLCRSSIFFFALPCSHYVQIQPGNPSLGGFDEADTAVSKECGYVE
jgi:hypothetical protein